MNSQVGEKNGAQPIVMATASGTATATIVGSPVSVAALKNDVVQAITSPMATSTTSTTKLSIPETLNFLTVKNQNGQMIIQQPARNSGNGPASTANNGNSLGAISNRHIIVRQKSSGGASGSSGQLGEVIERVGMKRSLPTSGNSIVTKVIITKNPVSGQPQAQAVRPVTQTITLPVSGSNSAASTMLGASVGQQLQHITTSLATRTLTLSQSGLPASVAPTTTTTDTLSLSTSPVKTVIATIPSSGVTKISVPYHKIPISPVKTPTKITMIPVSKSPSAGSKVQNTNITVLSKALSSLTQAGGVPLKPGSPSKVIIKQGPAPSGPSSAITLKPGTVPSLRPQVAITVRPGTATTSSAATPSLQQIQVPGSRFNYVRLVSMPTSVAASQLSSSATVPKSISGVASQALQISKSGIPITKPVNSSQSNQVKITLPVQQNTLLAPKPSTVPVNATAQTNLHRIILPATASSSSTVVQQAATAIVNNNGVAPSSTLPAIQPAPAPTAGQLPPGTAILSAGSGNLPGFQSIALVPASYVSQLQQLNKPVNSQTPVAVATTTVDPTGAASRQHHYVPIASIDPAVTQYTLSRNAPPQNGPTLEATGARPRKPCNCTKSQCLKLYCDCFANGEFCQNCNCTNCANNLEHEEERSKAIKCCLDRNPQAFHPKIGKAKDVEGNRRHTKGCNCKRSGCLKNYCECYEAKIMCSEFCKCVGCKNFEESPERKTLMHLADAAEVRVQQQTAAKTKLSSQISSVPSRPPVATASGERLPFALITADVAEATAACLLAQAEEAERMKMPPVVQERMIIEEFGRCLMQIIESANRTRTSTMS